MELGTQLHLKAFQLIVVVCGLEYPDNWTTDDDWQSFELWNDSEERIDIRKIYDVSNYQYQYENATFEPRANQESPYVVGI